MSSPSRTGFVPANGLQLFYEIHGEIHGTGQPLVLIHGGVAASEAFRPNLPALAATRQVIAVHLQGHGHTKDIDRPLRYEFLADDIAVVIRHLDLVKPDVLGYSLGGGVALQLAIRHPDAVGKLIVVSEVIQHKGWYPEVLATFKKMPEFAPQIAQGLKQSPLARRYPDVNWETVFRKIGEMTSHDYDWSAAVAAIHSPMMLVFADADAMPLEHIVEFYKLIGGGQRDAGVDGSLRSPARLAIVPGTTHYNLLATDTVSRLVAPFLGA